MTAHDEVLALLTESERINRRLWEIHVEQAEKQRQSPQTRTLSTFALREPMQVVSLHGPGAPCCDAYETEPLRECEPAHATLDDALGCEKCQLAARQAAARRGQCEDEPPGVDL